ncbi:hypothetical protein [Paractinoplanes durhamensis]|uniref:Uncharacterized protein n=1 Tax=Paractinoplanes durhamensis TaxID=113563 RepID=A0ABQ3Z8G0_9ACTN|nr:hypothetical protein [Actinoplanes durhamensis]GIE06129.1 hypothetical protein Adu01nite_74790 [Actinoplanes durhamensis]
MPDLAVRFGRLADEYETRKQAATAAVASWDWYTWPGLDPRPLHFERDLLKPGRRLDARPPVDRDVQRIGFDAQGRVAVIEEYSGFLNGRLYYETFLHYGDDVVEAAHFDTDRPIYLHEYRYEDGLMRSAETVARGGSGRESYAYTGGRISRIEIEHSGRSQAALVAEHDDRGLLRLVEAMGSATRVRYVRPPAGFDLEVACGTVEDMLVALIPAAAARLAVDEPIDCLALSYGQATQLSIEITAATAEERAELRSIDADAVWSPAEFETGTALDLDLDLDGTALDGTALDGTALDDTALDDTGPIQLVRQELKLLDADDVDVSAGSELGRRLLCAVALRLNRHDWSATLPVTDDFVVYAVDLELADLDRNLADCLPPDRLAQLREQGPGAVGGEE